jgi:ribosomal protein S17
MNLSKPPHIYHIISNRRANVGDAITIEASVHGELAVNSEVQCEGIIGEVISIIESRPARNGSQLNWYQFELTVHKNLHLNN